ncbi:hypothetical protein D3C78_1143530 [compost metagenome]
MILRLFLVGRMHGKWIDFASLAYMLPRKLLKMLSFHWTESIGNAWVCMWVQGLAVLRHLQIIMIHIFNVDQAELVPAWYL